MSDELTLPARPTRWDPREQPCVRVVTQEGDQETLSLRAVFEEAEDLSALDGSTSGETVAVIEYLLAICFAAGVFPRNDTEWREWVRGKRDLAPAAEWLRKRPDAEWNLFDQRRPLGQSAFLREDLDRCGVGPAQLVIEQAGDYAQLMDHRHLENAEPIPAADAFRAMLTQHQFGLPGRARISDNQHGAALTNLIGGRLQSRVRVVALGESVAETLRLNLYPVRGSGGSLNTTWGEKTGRREFTQRPTGRTPSGPADVHSYLGRSVLLRPAWGPDGEIVVDRVIIGSGELLSLDPDVHFEDAVPYVKANGVLTWLAASPTRDVWRDAHALYGAVCTAQSGFWYRLGKLPYERLGFEVPYQLWAVGMVAKKSLPLAWSDGCYPYAPGMEQQLYLASRRGSDIAEYLARVLGLAAWVAFDTVYPRPNPNDKDRLLARFDARTDFWQFAEDYFNALLQETAAHGSNPDELLLGYATELRETAHVLLDRKFDSLPVRDLVTEAKIKALDLFVRRMKHDDAPVELRGKGVREDGGTY
ncbi:type I-E CRISPR-associated protein Cse1/CasA [Streptomyces sp. NEAU-H3]|uniref:type I-E CRISPR-associated protein Cse1/CasA n=1 Tax=Streptomyces sp. NEAU-H3 TaxID=2720636 RepID=UPI001439A93E|nr:type I-E CRISPR-associated protein Cse1/CasA [Streptomyces sp. NEAU-H3]NJA59219.1 type I-E CRISPR-associated protein Cse1/CasA [Streptomyces sp. NEAU-H3]